MSSAGRTTLVNLCRKGEYLHVFLITGITRFSPFSPEGEYWQLSVGVSQTAMKAVRHTRAASLLKIFPVALQVRYNSDAATSIFNDKQREHFGMGESPAKDFSQSRPRCLHRSQGSSGLA